MIIQSTNGAVRLNATVGDILNDIDFTGLRLLRAQRSIYGDRCVVFDEF